jgi:transcriptional regulator with XRE-family HTH domain
LRLQQLRTVRQARALSQADLGRLTGLRQTYLSAIERGLIPGRLEHISLIARALSVPEDVLVATAISVGTDGTVEVAR